MSKVQMLRVLVNQRLTAAAEEIFELFEKTIAEYEEELCRSKANHGQHNPLEVRSQRADIQQLLVSNEEVPPEQQERSPRLDQKDPSDPPLIKEEQEALWINQEEEQLQGLEEADIIKSTFTPVPVKSEEVKPQLSQFQHSQTEENRDAERLKSEADGEDCGGSEPDRNFNPDGHLQPVTHEETSHSESETDDSRSNWEETSEPQSGLNALQNEVEPVGVMKCNNSKTLLSSSECAASVGPKEQLQKHNEIQTGEKPFSCSVCGKSYLRMTSLRKHLKFHSEGKRFSCLVCKKSFPWRTELVRHMRVHTGEKPFSCSICGMKFTHSSSLISHSRVHGEEKPFSCSICEASFSRNMDLIIHKRRHAAEKQFSCSVCGKRFTKNGNLKRHSTVHTGEKLFRCGVCNQSFTRLQHVEKHRCEGFFRGSE
uniref:zinc finger and SCAN domain-containing protein 2-like n=1 Tax=Semicossyphus pulcher TaxID=241346 RepID=UPI0037E72B94